MTIEQLKQLIEINKCNSMTQASKNLYISHQALSASIRSLEKEMQTVLVEKTPRGSRLTLKGKQLVDISLQFISQLDELLEKKEDIAHITIATSYANITSYLASTIFHIEQVHHLKIYPSFIELNTNDEIIKSIQTGLADIGFCLVFIESVKKLENIYENKSTYSNLEFSHVATLNVFCELRKQHPLSYLQQIPINKLKKYSLRYFFPRKIPVDIDATDLSRYSFSSFFNQFDYRIESNFAFYRHAIQYDNSIGILVGAPDTVSAEHCVRQLQAPCRIEIIAVRKMKNNYSLIEKALFEKNEKTNI